MIALDDKKKKKKLLFALGLERIKDKERGYFTFEQISSNFSTCYLPPAWRKRQSDQDFRLTPLCNIIL